MVMGPGMGKRPLYGCVVVTYTGVSTKTVPVDPAPVGRAVLVVGP
jgi:hypothetical protein